MAAINGVPFEQNLVSPTKHYLKCPNVMVAKKLTIHNTYNKAKAKNETDYCKNNDNQVSFHAAIDDNGASQVVPFNRNAWHCGDGGNGYGNRNTIGLEICYSTGNAVQYLKAEQNAIKFAAGLCVQQGIVATKDTIKKHEDWSGKHCPHRILDEKRWPAVQQAIINEYARIIKAPEPKPKGKKTVYAKRNLYLLPTGNWGAESTKTIHEGYAAVLNFDVTSNGFVQVEFQGKKYFYSGAVDPYWYTANPNVRYKALKDVLTRAENKWGGAASFRMKKGEEINVVAIVGNWLKCSKSGVIGYLPNDGQHLIKK
ncbi:N-acetylmuramoyl-L-alanine amidase family protein [Listeria sp. W9-0585]|uniref:N-acetylmuramoyl-L-alanine amidase n=1 Tax=Listeria rustica TaxID=2713503 RepID=A0A7W1YGD9_9LIST|nr:N-acetylmuramoyl-L-alanine amidase family protein [Listeria rustica]